MSVPTRTRTRPEPTGTTPAPFPPSEELGAHLRDLEQTQAEVNRRKAEELARLRAIQDRD